MNSCTIDGNQFIVDGKPLSILSGAMHYFRIVPEYWEDRLRKLCAMGLNTLETYVAWNLHEPRPGDYNFDGGCDLERYINIAGELGLAVIIRPGPYICSEWDLGGLPSWLLADPGMRLRCCYGPYLEAVDRYFEELLPRLVALQVSNGGPIIAMQVENEYGSYGNDADYLLHLGETIRNSGFEGLLFTSDGPTDAMLQYGTVPGILKTVNFGSNAGEAFGKLSEYQDEGPRVCMEFWNGWFDHWGEEHHTRDPEDAAAALDEMLGLDGSVNFYMFHGGTNFGFMNGANYGDGYQPTITSYDDDAPLTEHGEITPKFHAFRNTIGRYVELPPYDPPSPVPTMSIDRFTLQESAPLLSSLKALSSPVTRATPDPMEYLGQDYGFILYETSVSGPREEALLSVRDVHDRAHVYVDDRLLGILDRESGIDGIQLAIPDGGVRLRILVENMGRINYGNLLVDRKGITDAVMLERQILYGWKIYPLPLADLSRLDFTKESGSPCPSFYRGNFAVDETVDTFFYPEGWTKGVCWINGFNIGRYWDRGPQKTLYVPGPLLKTGENEITMLELDEPDPTRSAEFRAVPIL
jgi:beta-galactosidase